MTDFMQHITKGTWGRIKDDDISISGEGWMDGPDGTPTAVNGWVILGNPDDDRIAIAVIDLGPPNQWDDEKMDAHEALVVEAITVANDTGLSPKQLLRQRDGLAELVHVRKIQRDALTEAGTALMDMLAPWEFASPNPTMRDAIGKMRGALHWTTPIVADLPEPTPADPEPPLPDNQLNTGTVAHETGLSPREMADQRAELLAALESVRDCIRKGVTGKIARDAWTKANAAIAKAKKFDGAREPTPADPEPPLPDNQLNNGGACT